MTIAHLPFYENDRLKALNSYHLLDTLPEVFDTITWIASVICQKSISVISLINKDIQLIKSQLEIDLNQKQKVLSFCKHTINQPQISFEVKDVCINERFHDY